MAFTLAQEVTDKTYTAGVPSLSDKELSSIPEVEDKELNVASQWEDKGVSAFEDGQVIGLLLVFTYTF